MFSNLIYIFLKKKKKKSNIHDGYCGHSFYCLSPNLCRGMMTNSCMINSCPTSLKRHARMQMFHSFWDCNLVMITLTILLPPSLMITSATMLKLCPKLCPLNEVYRFQESRTIKTVVLDYGHRILIKTVGLDDCRTSAFLYVVLIFPWKYLVYMHW